MYTIIHHFIFETVVGTKSEHIIHKYLLIPKSMIFKHHFIHVHKVFAEGH